MSLLLPFEPEDQAGMILDTLLAEFRREGLSFETSPDDGWLSVSFGASREVLLLTVDNDRVKHAMIEHVAGDEEDGTTERVGEILVNAGYRFTGERPEEEA